MTAKPFSAEVLLLGWGTSPASGHWIKVQLDPALDGEAHPFRLFKSGAANGQRFRMDFAAIGDDESAAKPVAESSVTAARGEAAAVEASPAPPAAAEPKPTPRERYAGKTEGQKAVVRAGLLCEDAKFQRWLRDQYPVVWVEAMAGGDTAPDLTAATVLRRACFIASRGELATNVNALVRFADIESAFKAAQIVSQYSPHLTGANR